MSDVANNILKASMTTFNQTASVTTLFVVPIFLLRVVYLNAAGGGSKDYAALAKGVVLYFILIHGFEPILEILLTFPEHFAPELSKSFSYQKNDNASSLASAVNFVPNILTWTLESVIAVLYYAATSIHFVITILMSAMAPIIFLLGALLNIGLGVRVFFGLLVMVAAWPIVFAACDTLHSVLPAESQDGLPGLVFELVISFFKLAGPLAVAFFSLSSSAGQAVMATMTAGLSSMAFFANHSESFHKGLSGQANGGFGKRSLSDYSRQSTHFLAHTAGSSLRNLGPNKDLARPISSELSSQTQNHNSVRAKPPANDNSSYSLKMSEPASIVNTAKASVPANAAKPRAKTSSLAASNSAVVFDRAQVSVNPSFRSDSKTNNQSINFNQKKD